MSAPTSPQTSPRKGKYMASKVLMLDDTIEVFQIPQEAMGSVLFAEVARRLELLEQDYFDLEFIDMQDVPCWLDHEKPIIKQVPINGLNFRFLVKFYTPDPGLLEEEYTRYQFALQVRRDLASGAMPCQEHTAVLLASFIVQAELGDFLDDEYCDHSYLSNLRLLPNQTEELEIKIMEHHKEHQGQSPAEAEFNLLDTARKVELYGIRMHQAKDHEGVSLNLAVAHMGVLVFQNSTKINTFSWAKIRKLSFKRKKFLIKLHPEGYGYYKDTVEFYFETRNECKNFWKKCIEHHAFFRCHQVKKLPRNKTRVVSRGSSFRYSGRTQKQLVEYVRDNYTKRPPFQRSTSMRTMASTRSHGATPNTGTLNSRDIHFHNTSASSGSHTLDMNITRETLDAMGHRIETAEVHDDSSQSGSRSINSPKKDRDRDFSAPSGSDDQLDEDEEHYIHQDGAPPVPQGAHDEFNYSYYKLSYDASQQYQSVNQNASDNDDNVSQDSYHLTEEPGTPESLDNVLQSDDDGLDAVGEGIEEDRAKLIENVNRRLEESEKHREKGEIEGEQLKENGDQEDSERKVEIEIVEKVETISSFQKSPSMDKHELQRAQPSIEQNGKGLVNGRSRLDERSPSPVRRDSTEIPYVLHRRKVSPHSKLDPSTAKMTQSKSAPQHLASFKQTSPTKAIGSPQLPLTSEQRKAELDRIKTSLTTPIVPANQASSKSPGTKRAYDLVKYNRLPHRDSYSYIDDSISPSAEKDIISELRSKTLGRPVVPQKPPRDLDKKAMVLPGLVPGQDKVHLLPPRATMEDLTPTTETDSDSESPLPKDSPLEEEQGQRLSDGAGDKSSTSGSEAEHAKAKRRAYRINSKTSHKDLPFADDAAASSEEERRKPRLSSSASSEPLPSPPPPVTESPSDDFERSLEAVEALESPSEVFEQKVEMAVTESPPETPVLKQIEHVQNADSPHEDIEKLVEESMLEARAVQEDNYLDNMRLNDDLPTAPPLFGGDISSEDEVEHPDADDFTDSAAILEAQRRPTLEAIAAGLPASRLPDPEDMANLSPSEEFEKSLEYDLNFATQHIGDGQFSGEESSDSEGSLPPPPPPPVTHQGSISSEGEVEGPDADDFDLGMTTAILQAQRAPTIEADYPLSDHRQIELPPDIAAVPAPVSISSESDEDGEIETLPEMDNFEQKFEMEMNIDEEEDIQLLNEDGEVPGGEEDKDKAMMLRKNKSRNEMDSSDSCSTDSEIEPGATGGLPAPPPMVDISSESDVERPSAEDLPDPVPVLAAGSIFANPFMLHQLPEEDSSDSDPPPPPPPVSSYDTSLYANLPEPPSTFTTPDREGYGTLPGPHHQDDMDDPLESLEHLSETDSDKRKESESVSSSESDLEDVAPLAAQRDKLHPRPPLAPKPRNVSPMSFEGQGEVIGNPAAAMKTPEGEQAPGVFSNPYAETLMQQVPETPPRTSSVQKEGRSSPRH